MQLNRRGPVLVIWACRSKVHTLESACAGILTVHSPCRGAGAEIHGTFMMSKCIYRSSCKRSLIDSIGIDLIFRAVRMASCPPDCSTTAMIDSAKRRLILVCCAAMFCRWRDWADDGTAMTMGCQAILARLVLRKWSGWGQCHLKSGMLLAGIAECRNR